MVVEVMAVANGGNGGATARAYVVTIRHDLTDAL
jgi:hypothetical protein